MPAIGIITFVTDDSIQPVPLAQALEQRGFATMLLAEHTHIPASRQTPSYLGGDLPPEYWHTHDLFVALTAAAVATQTLNVGSGICLVPQHHPITLAKTTASLDVISNGRFLFGIGAGWNVEEMSNHAVDFKDRWKITRERVLAMREIWTKDEPEFHGDFVDFDPLWSYPKPLTPGGPPVYLGAGSKWSWDRVADYCDGWNPIDGHDDLAAGLDGIRAACDRRGRDFADIRLSVNTIPSEERVQHFLDLGFTEVNLLLPTLPESDALITLDRYTKIVEAFP